jgi:hypothetical protein
VKFKGRVVYAYRTHIKRLTLEHNAIAVSIDILYKIEELGRTCLEILFSAETEEQIVENQMCYGHVLVQ